MYFGTPPHIPQFPFEPPDTVPVHEFIFDNKGVWRWPPNHVRKAPFTCGVTSKSYTAEEVTQRIEYLARGLAQKTGWQVNEGHEMEKMVAIFAINTIDTMTVSWATHRLNGVSCPINAGYSLDELAGQLRKVHCKALFTCKSLLKKALEAADLVGLSRTNVFLLDTPPKATDDPEEEVPINMMFVDDLIDDGADMAVLPPLHWSKGQGERQTAFLCSSSGTSGLPKSVKISHRNVISNIMSLTTYEGMYGDQEPEIGLGTLPQSHGYALVLISQASVYRGDGVIVLNGFDLTDTLGAIEKFQIRRLWVIPSMVVAMTKATHIVHNYDISSVKSVVVGASPIPKETLALFKKMIPGCHLNQAYGLTEASVMITMTNREDDFYGSCGHLLPGFQARIIDQDGREVTNHNTPGQLLVHSTSIMLGYYDNEKATRETLNEEGWLRTGDLVEVRKSPRGFDHLFIVDRIKEIIKVRGMQVAPAELENFLLQQEAVADVAVVPIPSESSGELPRGYVVRRKTLKDSDEAAVKAELHRLVKAKFASYKQLDGGIVFVTSLPKTASGKTQRNKLKEIARASLEQEKRILIKAVKPFVQVFEIASDEESDF